MMEETQHMKLQLMGHLQCLYTKLNMEAKIIISMCEVRSILDDIFLIYVIILHYTQ